MLPRVDWLSWTAQVGKSSIGLGPTYTQRTLSQIIEASPDPVAALVAASDWIVRPGKNFYRHRLSRDGGGCDIFSSPDRPEALVELSGVGCAMIPDDTRMVEAISTVCATISRIDLAADFLDPLSPFTFAHARSNRRFRRISTEQSDTGESVYIGSWKSDKFARVYRYFPPHPRHKFLRIEHVYRRKQARQAATFVADHGIEDSLIAAGNYYGWNHPLWTDASTHDEELSAWQPERGSPNSVRWILTQVFPALRKMESAGVIESIDSFLDEHLRTEREAENVYH